MRLPQVAGWGNAMRYLLTGEEFGAREAERIGLIQQVVDPGSQRDHAIELAETVARQAPLAVRQTMRSARIALEQGPAAALAAMLDQARELMATDDAREGVMSFVERREARFKGR